MSSGSTRLADVGDLSEAVREQDVFGIAGFHHLSATGAKHMGGIVECGDMAGSRSQAGAQPVSQPSAPEFWLLLADDKTTLRQIRAGGYQSDPTSLFLSPALAGLFLTGSVMAGLGTVLSRPN